MATEEIKLQYGKNPYTKEVYEMTPEEQKEYNAWAEKTIRENIFSRNQALVYQRDTDQKWVAEYKDGSIKILG